MDPDALERVLKHGAQLFGRLSLTSTQWDTGSITCVWWYFQHTVDPPFQIFGDGDCGRTCASSAK